jgi:hypothetical protein
MPEPHGLTLNHCWQHHPTEKPPKNQIIRGCHLYPGLCDKKTLFRGISICFPNPRHDFSKPFCGLKNPTGIGAAANATRKKKGLSPLKN